MVPDTNRPKRANSFEVERGMTGIALEQRVIFIGEVPNVLGQSLVECLEF